MNIFSIENVYLCSQNLLPVSLGEYSVIKSDVIKRFDCIHNHLGQIILNSEEWFQEIFF